VQTVDPTQLIVYPDFIGLERIVCESGALFEGGLLGDERGGLLCHTLGNEGSPRFVVPPDTVYRHTQSRFHAFECQGSNLFSGVRCNELLGCFVYFVKFLFEGVTCEFITDPLDEKFDKSALCVVE
jgi:hypothetical protein